MFIFSRVHTIFPIFIKNHKIPELFHVLREYCHFSRFSRPIGNPNYLVKQVESAKRYLNLPWLGSLSGVSGSGNSAAVSSSLSSVSAGSSHFVSVVSFTSFSSGPASFPRTFVLHPFYFSQGLQQVFRPLITLLSKAYLPPGLLPQVVLHS